MTAPMPNPFLSEIPRAGSPAPSVSLGSPETGGVSAFKLDERAFMAALLNTASRAKEPEANAGSAATNMHRPAWGSSRRAVARSTAATSEVMDVTAGETAPLSRDGASETRGGAGDDCSVGKRGAWPHHDGQVDALRSNVGQGTDVTARRDEQPSLGVSSLDLAAVPSGAAALSGPDLNAKNIATLLALAESDTASAETSSTLVKA